MRLRRRYIWLATILLFSFAGQAAPAQETGNVARLVFWKMKAGMDRDFEQGYKRHLEWHRNNHDLWSWFGWSIISGERDGYFVDGTFFHNWTDLDSPVNPSADGADLDLNVTPYGDAQLVATYESVPGLTSLGPRELTSPLLTFCYFAVRPGGGAEFESLLAPALQIVKSGESQFALLRPVNGANEYVLLLAARKLSEQGRQAQLLARVLESAARDKKGSVLVERFRTETARYRPDMSNVPNETSAATLLRYPKTQKVRGRWLRKFWIPVRIDGELEACD